MNNIGSKLVKLFMWGLGLGLIFYGVSLLISSSKEWSEAQAEVVSSSKQYTSSEDPDSYSISYTYQVDGVEYTNFMSSDTDYPAGYQFTVYYETTSPEVAFETQGQAAFLGVGSCLFGLVCVGSMAWGAWKSRSAKDTALPVQGSGPGGE